MSGTKRVRLFDLPLDLVSRSEAVDYIMGSIQAGEHITQMSLNAPKVLAARQDPDLKAALERSDLVTADGSWVAFAAKLCGMRVPERFGGIDLFEALLAASADQGRSVFFFGATDNVVDQVALKAQTSYPQLMVAGVRDGFFGDKEGQAISTMIRESGADLLFLGFPSPRKEKWLDQFFEECGVRFAMGVGGSFDVFAGMVPRAPRFMQRTGLEWLWRLKLEPRRMWKRYLGAAPRFAAVILTEAVRFRTGLGGVAHTSDTRDD